MAGPDFAAHNEEVRQVWEAFHAGRPTRVPCAYAFNTRYLLLTPELNPEGYTFQQYFEDPDLQWRLQLHRQHWIRHNVVQDAEMGLPEEWGGLAPDLQNIYEAAWLGCRIEHREGNVVDTWPLLKENKAKLYDLSLPDPLRGNIMGQAMEFYEYFEDRRSREDFFGRPVGHSEIGGGTDGPFTVACSLRGATELCLDLYEDPGYAHDLLDFVTRAAITRIQAVAEFRGRSFPVKEWGFADDSIELLSPELYREFVLPYHRRLVETFSAGGPNSIHLCGHAQHHFRTLQQELNVQSFDTGFPTDLGRARRELGPGALLRGNLHPQLLVEGPVEAIVAETRRLLRSGVMEGGRYIFGEGSNVSPGTPPAHFRLCWETVRAEGRY